MSFVTLPLCTWCLYQGPWPCGAMALNTVQFCWPFTEPSPLCGQHLPLGSCQAPPRAPPPTAPHHTTCAASLSCTPVGLWLTRGHLEQALGPTCMLAGCWLVPCVSLSV